VPGFGDKIYDFCKEIFPINRSITGDGVRETLQLIQKKLPNLKQYSIPTGESCFDWVIPKEWNVCDAYIIDPDGIKICDFKENNLHLVGYSTPIDAFLSFDELDSHLHSLPGQPDAIPYITSYYNENWGFCLSHNQRRKLKKGKYKVFINSSLKKGELVYGELLVKGRSKEEIFFSTYICHPSMGNNETSGPALLTFLAKYISSIKDPRYSYRIIFIPETIGSIAYLSRNLKYMQKNMQAGFNITCVGDDNNYSFLPSRSGTTLSDKISRHLLKNSYPNYSEFSFLDRGSDERQYCFPGVDLPVCSIMRSKYGEYDEYHTSLDDLSFISSAGLGGSYIVYKTVIDVLERNYRYVTTTLCEPQLGKRNMYPNTSTKITKSLVKDMMNFLTYCDGNSDLVDIANIINVPVWKLFEIVKDFESAKLIKRA